MNIKDIAKFRQLMFGGGSPLDSTLSRFYKPYAFSNEYLNDYFCLLDLQGKRVLTTGSSGDQILFSILYGASEVTCFDINPFVKYLFGLKVAYIKNLSYKQFNSMIDGDNYCDNNLFDKTNYDKVKHVLSPDVKVFWDSAFAGGLNKNCSVTQGTSYAYNRCAYLTDKHVYKRLQQVLLNGRYSVDFINCDIRNLCTELGKLKFEDQNKYDAIFLSNIFDYSRHWEEPTIEDDFNDPTRVGNGWQKYLQMIEGRADRTTHKNISNYNYGLMKFKMIVDGLANFYLKKNGMIQLSYWWNDSYYSPNNLKAMYDNDNLTYISARDGGGTLFYAPQKANDRAGSNYKQPGKTNDNQWEYQ